MPALIDTLPLAISYLVIYSILIFFLIKQKGYFFSKLLVICLMTALTITTWKSSTSLFGWCTYDTHPSEYVIVGVAIVEPSSQKAEDGGIYMQLLYKDTDNNSMFKFFKPRKNQPRTYFFTYSQERHKQAMDIQKLLGNGRLIKGTSKPFNDLNSSIQYFDNQEPLFYLLPTQELPRKNN